ncbi:hypothetical protein AB0D08_18085 [Kitasatospora sp. NPDC048540]|uniref:hypothetical protein n=1 Tax=unclassified Kitasatospora TaxID=2633591 RepID=UPI000691004A|nr:hypothetical protein [Kitasatospora sp. MBT63]
MEAAVETAQTMTENGGPGIPAHARPGLRHWALVAAGCAAVVGGALAATPATGSVRAAAPTAATPAPTAAAPDPAKAELPLDCGPFPVAIGSSFPADLGGNRPVTVVAAHCAADNGTPPDGIFLLGPGTGGRPVVLETLLRPEENLTVTRLAPAGGYVTAHVQGYSGEDVPRCCPDVSEDLSWVRRDGRWTRGGGAAPTTQV